MAHRSGFVNIIGRPNVGKSTLMNTLLGEKLSIITSKAQTTRHRIMGIINGEDFQVIYSDTPGIIRKPSYRLQEAMNDFALSSSDADVLIFVTDPFDDKENIEVIDKILRTDCYKILVVNKIDLEKDELVSDIISYWQSVANFNSVLQISALKGQNIEELFDTIVQNLPLHPPYYPKDQLTDKPERFFVGEIIRGKIFENYKKEIPYSSEVEIESFKEEESIIRIGAIIYVERKSQKGIIIGKDGTALKKVGTEARLEMEDFLNKKVFLDLHVKVKENWRADDRLLKNFGYKG